MDEHVIKTYMRAEPVFVHGEGESGVHELSADFLQLARELCTASDTVLIHDEIQTGSGRTGTFLCGEQANVTPNITTLAPPSPQVWLWD